MNTQHSERQANLYQSILQEPSKSNLSYPNPFSSFPYQQQGVGFSSPSYSSTQPTRSPTPSSFYKYSCLVLFILDLRLMKESSIVNPYQHMFMIQSNSIMGNHTGFNT